MSTDFDEWWLDAAVQTGLRAGQVDLVYASLSPYASGEAARRIALARDVPWAVDLRDPWALDEMTVYPTRLHRRHELGRMARALTSATAVILNTSHAARSAARSIPQLDGTTIVIPNGWEAADFADPEPVRPDAAFRIVHTGYLHTDLGWESRRRKGLRSVLGGSVKGTNPLTRSHVFLLAAIKQLRMAHPRLGDNIEVHLAGVLSEADEAIARGSNVRAHGYLPHSDSIRLVRSADLLFLPMHDLPTGVRATIVPGKTYEYLASGRPILAALPDGDARDLLSAAPETAHICRPDGIDEMRRIIERECLRHATGGRAPTHIPAVAFAYESRELTARLARVFDELLGSATASLPRRVALTA